MLLFIIRRREYRAHEKEQHPTRQTKSVLVARTDPSPEVQKLNNCKSCGRNRGTQTSNTASQTVLFYIESPNFTYFFPLSKTTLTVEHFPFLFPNEIKMKKSQKV